MIELPGSMNENVEDRRVPVGVLTGFLGAGKTTLLNRLLSNPAFSRTAVLINEFGEVAVDQPLDWLEFSEGLSLLLAAYGHRVLRIKGLLNVSGDPLPRIVQCVQHAVYPPTTLLAWPESGPYADRRSRLVFIVRELPREEVAAILGSLFGQVPVSS